jgi:hypothetical protein
VVVQSDERTERRVRVGGTNVQWTKERETGPFSILDSALGARRLTVRNRAHRPSFAKQNLFDPELF